MAARAGADLRDRVTANRRRAWLLIAAFVGVAALVLLAVGLLLGAGPVAVVPALAVPLLAAAWAYLRSDAVVLAASRAEPADPASQARLHNLVEGLCTAAGLPKPSLYVIDDPAPNAFATGRDPSHAAVAVTSGLLERLDRVQLEGVLAHELSHVKSHDTLVSTLAVTLLGGATLAADVALPTGRRDGGDGGDGFSGAVLGAARSLLLLQAPLSARAVGLAVGHQRERSADEAAVSLTRYPPGLARALEVLRAEGTAVRTASPATAHLWIAPPLAVDAAAGARPAPGARPSLAQRIDELRAL